MGMTASDLKALEDDAKAYDAALQSANLRPLTFTLKVAEDTYNDETRIKKSVNRQGPCCQLPLCVSRSLGPVLVDLQLFCLLLAESEP